MNDQPDGGPGEPESSRPSGEPGPSLIGLIPVVLQSLAALLAGKLRLAEREFSRDLATIRSAAWLVGAAVVLATLAFGLAGAGAALLLGRWLDSPGGGLMAVAGAYLALALASLAVARSRIRRMDGFLKETRADLRRDADWLKDLS